MDAIQKTGKTVDEAVNAALAELKISKEDAEIEIIEEGSRGFLGRLKRNLIPKRRQRISLKKCLSQWDLS